jgi:hypothetical protein
MADSYWKRYRSKIKDAKQGVNTPTSNKKNRKYSKKNFTLYVQHSEKYISANRKAWSRLLGLPWDGTEKIGTYAKLRDVENAVSAYKKGFRAEPEDTFYYIDTQGNKNFYEN